MIYYTNFHIMYRIIDAQGLYCCCLLQLNTFHIPFRYIIIIHTLLVSTKQVMLLRLIRYTYYWFLQQKLNDICCQAKVCSHLLYLRWIYVLSLLSFPICVYHAFVFIHIYVLCFMYTWIITTTCSLYILFLCEMKN